AISPSNGFHPMRLLLGTRVFSTKCQPTNVTSREYLEVLGKELGITKLEDWYFVNQTDMLQKGGSSAWNLLQLHQISVGKLLASSYPEHNWVLHKFNTIGHGIWERDDNCRMFFDWLADQLGIQHPDGWYSVTNKDVYAKGGGKLLWRFGDF